VTGLLLAVLFIALNGFFVAAEFALVKVRATQLSPRARRGEKTAIIAQEIIARLDRYLSTTQLGITLASLGLGWIGEPALAKLFAGPFAYLPIHSPRALEVVTVVFAFGLLTFAHVVLGELVPKLIAIQRTEQTALVAALPLRIVYLTFKPALWTLEKTTRVMLRLMGLDPDVTNEGTISEEEIVGILAASTARSPRAREKSELVERVLRFSQRTARHALVPRVDVAYVPVATSVEAAAEQFRVHGYSRLLVTKERSLDDVVGYLYVKDLLDRRAADAKDLRGLQRDILFVPESRNLVEVLRDMQRKSTPIAVVVDEYGGTSGIVTMEDLLEEIVGEIRDELDEEPPRIVKADGGWEVDGRATMEDIGKQTGIAFDDASEQVGVVIGRRLAHIPRVGDHAEIADGVDAEVVTLHRRRITKVKVTRKERPVEETR
jgi:CBS domain containing-hemolysin-like protein